MLPTRRKEVLERISQSVDYAFGAIYSLVAFQFALEMCAARDGNRFKQFLDALTHPFLAPFRTRLPEMRMGGSEVIFSYVAALVAYALLHVGLRRLATILLLPPHTD